MWRLRRSESADRRDNGGTVFTDPVRIFTKVGLDEQGVFSADAALWPWAHRWGQGLLDVLRQKAGDER